MDSDVARTMHAVLCSKTCDKGKVVVNVGVEMVAVGEDGKWTKV